MWEKLVAGKRRVSRLSNCDLLHALSINGLEIPKFIHESGLSGGKMVAVTQPRRVAATSLAKRVAEETGTELGQLVG